MNASIEERAKRRQKEMIEKGLKVDIERLKHEIRQRDKSDSTREHGALKKAADAVEIDTSNLTFDEQVAFIVAKAKERGA
jgi:cytidylate kinase